jgi:uncharacterized protein (DUF1501 family)
MHINRRNFLKWTAAGLGAAMLPAMLPQSLFADTTAPYTGPFLVTVHASGAWDPTFLCNPTSDPEMNRVSTDAATAGAIRYSPWAVDPVAMNLPVEAGGYLMSNEAFFTKHANRLTVLNGVDTSTNNHETGTRIIWSGRSSEGYPALGALYAATQSRTQGLAFISGGGYDATANLVPLTRVSSTNSLSQVARPNISDFNNPDRTYHTPAAYDLIRQAQADRLAEQTSAAKLPSQKKAMGELLLARSSSGDLARLQIPETLVSLPGYQLGDLQRLMQQSQIAIAAFSSGLAVSASVVLGGFDTHANHDRDQTGKLAKLLYGIDYIWEEAGRAGIQDKLVIAIGSDFGRGPRYNGTNGGSGKDHWPITSMMFMGANIPGGRVIGGTDADQKPLLVDPSTLELSTTGVRLTPGTIQRAMRRALGIAAGEPAAAYALAGDDLPLFG